MIFFTIKSLSCFGLAFPEVCFIIKPTKYPRTLVFPFLICSICFGFFWKASSINSSNWPPSDSWARSSSSITFLRKIILPPKVSQIFFGYRDWDSSVWCSPYQVASWFGDTGESFIVISKLLNRLNISPLANLLFALNLYSVRSSFRKIVLNLNHYSKFRIVSSNPCSLAYLFIFSKGNSGAFSWSGQYNFDQAILAGDPLGKYR